MQINKMNIFQILIIAGIGTIIGILLSGPDDPKLPAKLNSHAKTKQVQNSVQSNIASVQTPTTSSGINQSSSEIGQIRSLLDKEIEIREQLQQKLIAMQEQIDAMDTTGGGGRQQSSIDNQQRITSTTQTRRMSPANRSWFNETALIESGVDETEANRLRDIFEKTEMDKLYLRDKAIREGWMGQARYRKERDALNSKLDGLREELDDQTYDAFLYASGRPNRVVINSTLSNSPASEAGLQPGDVILSYNDKRVYTAGELREMTTQGETGAVVKVQYVRDGQLVSAYLPIGPLGIRMSSRSSAPN